MDHDICCGWMGARFSVGKKFGTDWLQLDSWDAKKEDIDQWSIGGSDHWYDVENNRVRAFDSDRTTWAVQASALRTVSNSYNMFVVESFMDEVAHALDRDPLEFRLALLNGKGSSRGIPNAGYAPGTPSDYYMDRLWISLPWPTDNSWPPYESTTVGGALRLANCLRVAAGRAGWGAKTLPPNTGMGIAVSSAEERQSPTWVAGIAEVTVDPKTGRYKINRLTIAMDPGTVINPLCAKAQVQGSALWGASQVMAERLTLKDGAFEQSNFHDYTPIRLADVPPIDVELIDFGPPPERSWRARVHGRGPGGRKRDLQRRRRACAAHADHGRGGSGRIEKEGVILERSLLSRGTRISGRGIAASPACYGRICVSRRHSLAVSRRHNRAL